jgi:uncharacterized protein
MQKRSVSAGALLREARTEAGLTQAEVARRAGVTQSVISAYESGDREPSLPTLVRLVEATGGELDVQVRPARSKLRRLTGPVGRRVRQQRREIKRVAERHGISNVRVFGSVARGEDRSDSDVDLLVDLSPGVGLFTLARLQRELEQLLSARVDLIPDDGLKPAGEGTVHSEAVAL